jgi:asparagine synthase (glutamine-hydrolysing)
MCGIAGFWSKNGALPKADFDKALKLMQHRGPDDVCSVQNASFNLGTQRLKIIGIDSGQQPIQDNSGNCLSFNGAIYNYLEIAKKFQLQSTSDSEILFQLLLKEKVNTIDHLRGMFAFAFYDQKEDSFLLVRDRMGQKPLYYYQDEECLLFASELKTVKALMKLKEKPIKINSNAIYHYLSFSNIPEPETVYENIYTVPPAHYLKFQNEKKSLVKYWQHEYLPKSLISFEDAKIEGQRIIEESTKIRLRADVPLGIFLSGGWDSSIIAYEASKYNQNIKAFTVEYPFQTTQNESKIAKETAAQFGLQHEIIKVNHKPLTLLEKAISTFDQPLADSSALPNLAIAKAASSHVKVMLNGDGGDEQFGGYRRYFTAKNERKLKFLKYLKTIQASGGRRSLVGFLKRTARVMNVDLPERYLLYTVDMFQDQDMPNFWNNSNQIRQNNNDLLAAHFDQNLSSLDQIMHWDRLFNLLSGILVKMDRASMAYSVEARSPFLDHQLFEFSSQLPDSFKISGFNRKYLLKSIYADKLPSSVTKAPKTSFEAPLADWLKNDFKSLIRDLLYNPQAKIYRYVNYTEIILLLKGVKYQERNTDYITYSLLILEMWLIENE